MSIADWKWLTIICKKQESSCTNLALKFCAFCLLTNPGGCAIIGGPPMATMARISLLYHTLTFLSSVFLKKNAQNFSRNFVQSDYGVFC